jgi:beta-galactosidase
VCEKGALRGLVLFIVVTWAVVAMPGGRAFGRDAEAAPAIRQRGSLNAGWRFHQGDLAAQGELDDSTWRQLDLPHDWGIEGPFDQQHPGETGKLPWWGVGWYRKRLEVAAGERGLRFYLDVDGAMSHAQVWLNGQLVGGWPYGYASFRLDLTPFIRTGQNQLAIRLDNPPASSRWYPGGGIYRNVWLVKTAPLHIGHGGIFVTTPKVSAQAATVMVAVTLENHGKEATQSLVRTTIFPLDPQGKRGARAAASAPVPLQIAAEGTASTTLSLSMRKPGLWGPGHPQLHVAVTTVERAGQVVDRVETTFGIRTVRFDPAQGLLVNGQHVPLRGVCLHHDLGALGPPSTCALPPGSWRS